LLAIIQKWAGRSRSPRAIQRRSTPWLASGRAGRAVMWPKGPFPRSVPTHSTTKVSCIHDQS
jgi:hypothetical protein